ncbi:hypothetical protein FOG51_00676 [Hanseniaspora uvarum]|uniref:Dynamin-related protein DNM1 n=1 Tax=Hanseniaspora uvarum TaxID=29833 RepID=A0A1E5RZ66_HANUV|nr:hypothetical protein FOG51_00676 [Hanseniaspora uvarum]KKA03402.1 Dynamin-related protein HuDNM1 [Hanseniaspora uvarum DSM 2768]OEJ92038.1 Dynamin-related protein DNM1 [Hanseniaspora uvarum]
MNNLEQAPLAHKLIPIIDKLSNIVYEQNLNSGVSGDDVIDLPTIAVIGSQSSGKSSILETLVGKDFLPRGTGIVTRRPLVLQLCNIKETDIAVLDIESDANEQYNSEEGEVTLEEHLKRSNPNYSKNMKSERTVEWGEFLHFPGKRFFNFDDIRKEIEAETFRIAGKNKGISNNPINLKIYSPNVVNLTLIDLPGITKVPIGEQPADIEFQIKNLIYDYISKPNCIILAVSPANQDLVNSESLKFARDVDPLGKRTIGVITKLDLMDDGTNALEILTGKVYPLKLGFVGVVNRSQQDVNLNKTVKQSLEKERKFFVQHQAYKTIASKCGTKYLGEKLSTILMNHIKEKLPDLKAKISYLINQTEQELSQLGYDEDEASLMENKPGLILQLMNNFAKNFVSSIEGTSSNINTKELSGGARIYYIYNNVFSRKLNSINPIQDLTIEDIRIAIRNSKGPRSSLFVPELAFDLLVKPQINLLSEPSQLCVELVYEELMKIIYNTPTVGAGGLDLKRYPLLKNQLIDVVNDLLKERLTPTKKYVESLIEIHTNYINTNHPNFPSAAKVMQQIFADKKALEQETKRKELMIQNEKKLNSLEIADETDILENALNDKATLNGSKSPIPDGSATDTEDYLAQTPINDADIDENEENGLPVNADNKGKETFLKFLFGKDPIQKSNSTGTNNIGQNMRNIGINPSSPGKYMANGVNNTASYVNEEDQFQKYFDQGINNSSHFDDNDELTEEEKIECELISRLIISYFNIIKEMIEDQIPKAIMTLLVNHVKESISNRLVVKLYKTELFDELLKEDDDLRIEKEKLLELLTGYKKAGEMLNGI